MILFGRSHFSVGESMLKPADIIALASSLGYSAACLMDTMQISGMIDFSKAAKEAGVKPLIGVRVRCVPDPLHRKPKKGETHEDKPNPETFHDVIIKNDAGLGDIFELLSRAYSSQYFYYRARVGFADLEEVIQRGNLVSLNSDAMSVFHTPHYDDIASQLPSAQNAELSVLAIQPIETPYYDQHSARVLAYAEKHDLPVIAYLPCFYLEGQADSRDIYRVIAENSTIDNTFVKKPFARDLHPKRVCELADALKAFSQRMDLKVSSQMLRHHQVIEDAVTYEWHKLPISLPKLCDDEDAELVRLAKIGFKERFSKPVMGHKPDTTELPLYRDRLAYELSVLKTMGFAGYFLLVRDLVTWSKESGILVGPGRGSVGGSLVSYLLGITDVDPIRFDLLFERFINPDRLDLPDIDLDFMSSRRGEIVIYLREKYGADRVAGITNYSQLGCASALRDVGRVHGLSMFDLAVSKKIPDDVTLEQAREAVPEIESYASANPDLWRHSIALTGAMRSFGQHAAGVIVGGQPLIKMAVIESRTLDPVVNWDKRVCEDMGMVKLDVLGLSNLDVIQQTVERVKARKGKDLDLLDVSLDLPDVLEAFSLGQTTAVFQFESGGMKGLLKDLAFIGCLNFENLVAASALYRPGPMESGMLETYVNVTKGFEAPTYPHPKLVPALEKTQGVFIFQENVMQAAQALAGFTMAEADALRSAMGKKDAVKMAKSRDLWVDGCMRESGMEEEAAADLFDKIEKFAGYGFNRSHSVEYTILSYWTMFLKVRHPAEFFASCLSVMDSDRIPGLVADASKRGISIGPPDINTSTDRYEIYTDPTTGRDTLVAPLNAVANISDKGARAIMEARETAGGSFTDRDQFSMAVNRRIVNVRVVRHLDLVGAFASIEPGTPSATDSSRLKDQLTLMPGVLQKVATIERDMTIDKSVEARLLSVVNDYSRHYHDRWTSVPKIGKRAKIMVIFDAPLWSDEIEGKLLSGKPYLSWTTAAHRLGLDHADVYYTTLMKFVKEKDGQFETTDIGKCSEYLLREIDVLNPPVIVTMGSLVTRLVADDSKKKPAELAGKSIYDPKNDRTVIYGFNQGMLFFKPEMTVDLEGCIRKAIEAAGL